ncbi:MAG: segregation/condensation protein A [Candidatus Paceibacterota bacterium]
MVENYRVKLESFEGPLDLLLTLIEERKMHISDVSLAAITDDYLSYLEEAESVHLRHTAEFILVASTLVLIKSRSLLPNLKLKDEEEESIESLEEQLMQYKRFRELSVYIQNHFGKKVLYQKSKTPSLEPVFSPTAEITKSNLLSAIYRVIQSLPKIEYVPQVVMKKMLSLKEVIDSLTERINSALSVSFKEFSGGQKERVTIVIGFLAMLELVRRGVITAEQQKHFGDITMGRAEVDTPHY